VSRLAIIGGSGLDVFDGFEGAHDEVVRTPYGTASSPLRCGRLGGVDTVFLARHGTSHDIPPHRINYRANIWSLHHAGASHLVAVAAVGGIDPALAPGALVVPDQLIDYTSGREHTFHDGAPAPVVHVDFTHPYCDDLRRILLRAAGMLGLAIHDGGTYGATQGPRLETAAEVDRLARDGCAVVGMTGMPEASLARELGLCYATCAVVANAAAGRAAGEIRMPDVAATLRSAMGEVRRLLHQTAALLWHAG